MVDKAACLQYDKVKRQTALVYQVREASKHISNVYEPFLWLTAILHLSGDDPFLFGSQSDRYRVFQLSLLPNGFYEGTSN